MTKWRVLMVGEGDEIVRTRGKHRGYVNPLVPGSSPGGPTKNCWQLLA